MTVHAGVSGSEFYVKMELMSDQTVFAVSEKFLIGDDVLCDEETIAAKFGYAVLLTPKTDV